MIEWADINNQLLTLDHCSNILMKALQTLDGLTSFLTEILGMPTWSSVSAKYNVLFLFKLNPLEHNLQHI